MIKFMCNVTSQEYKRKGVKTNQYIQCKTCRNYNSKNRGWQIQTNAVGIELGRVLELKSKT